MTDSALLQELNDDIWRAFQKSYTDGDAAAFLALHSPDLIRAGGPTMQVYGYDVYADQTRRMFAELAGRGISVAVQFRFVERIAEGALASERGIFRITSTRPDGDVRLFHGKFHTLARKVDGRWLLVADYDSDEDGTITATTFDAATEMDDLDAFSG